MSCTETFFKHLILLAWCLKKSKILNFFLHQHLFFDYALWPSVGSPTRTHAPWHWERGVLTTGLPGSPFISICGAANKWLEMGLLNGGAKCTEPGNAELRVTCDGKGFVFFTRLVESNLQCQGVWDQVVWLNFAYLRAVVEAGSWLQMESNFLWRSLTFL